MEYKVSVIFITYNHEKYVEKALRSVLAQETDFPFEVVIGEDCSTDRTGEIVSKIAAEYPEHEAKGPGDKQIRLFLRSENTGGHPTLNVYETTMRCQAEYLAYLEGDDFWTDPKKLQKQVDFLEKHPEYIGVTHDLQMVDAEDQPYTDPAILSIGDLYRWEEGAFTYHDYCYSGKFPGHYATLVSRNIYPEAKYDYSILHRASDFTDDAVILLFLLMQGEIYRMGDVMSAWRYIRKSGGENWNSVVLKRDLFRENAYLSKTLMQWMEENKELTEYAKIRCRQDFGLALRFFLKKPCRENLQFMRDMFDYGIVHVVREDKKIPMFLYSINTIFKKMFGGNA